MLSVIIIRFKNFAANIFKKKKNLMSGNLVTLKKICYSGALKDPCIMKEKYMSYIQKKRV